YFVWVVGQPRSGARDPSEELQGVWGSSAPLALHKLFCVGGGAAAAAPPPTPPCAPRSGARDLSEELQGLKIETSDAQNRRHMSLLLASMHQYTVSLRPGLSRENSCKDDD